MIVALLGQTGRLATDWIGSMGRMFSFLLSAFFLAFRRPAKLRLIVYHIKTIGVDSLSVVALSGLSIAQNKPVEFPDFTRGKWKDRKPGFAMV